MNEGGEDARRLSAILAADVVGYTRLMEEDTDGTVAAWKEARSNVIDPKIESHSGRIVKHTGDGFLAEFQTVQDAVTCAAELQNDLAACPLEFRMGVNLGDIIDDGEDIHGEGVNIAARIEALAEPGAICISSGVFEQVRNRLDYEFEDLGEHEVKHVSAPIRIYNVSTVEAEAPSIESNANTTASAGSDKPSLAVLPFDNMSGDPEQEYFVDGVTEDIITELSRNRWMTVIARNTTFTYKGRAVNVAEVAKELDVRYVIEGSVRKSGDRMRINVQLIEGSSGNHVWAERFDRQVVDIFDLQDEITRNIAAAVEPEVFALEGHNASKRDPSQISAWETLMKARTHFWLLNKADTDEAIRLMRKVVEDFPDLPFASSALAFMYIVSIHMGWRARDPELDEAERLARKAATMDERDSWAHIALGYLQMMHRNPDGAVSELSRSLDLNPNSATAFSYRGLAKGFGGNCDDALADIEQALRLSPRDPQVPYFVASKAVAHFVGGQYEEASKCMDLALQDRPDFPGAYRVKAASLAHLDRIDEAREIMDRYKVLYPDSTLALIEATQPYAVKEDLDNLIEGLRLAGLK